MPTVLLTSAGRRNQLLGCFRQSGNVLGLPLRVIAVDLCPELSAACAQADRSFIVPRCDSQNYIQSLLEICRREKVDLLVPTIDPELTPISRAEAAFSALGTRVVVSKPTVTFLAGNKFGTAETLSRAGIPTPKTIWLKEYLADPDQIPGPVIAKPNSGSASVGIVRAEKPEDLFGLQTDQYIVQELWKGSEYTVNLFFDKYGHLRCSVPHLRIEVRSGEISKGRTECRRDLMEAAQKVAIAIPGAHGPLCFQAIVKPDGRFCVFEINARFGGGYPLAHEAGATFTQWLLEESMGLPCSASNQWTDGKTMVRYDAAVFF